MSFRSKDKNPKWEPQRLKRNFPAGLPVFSVETEEEANTLLGLACTMGYGSEPRMGLPHIIREDIENMDAVTEHLAMWYDRIKAQS